MLERIAKSIFSIQPPAVFGLLLLTQMMFVASTFNTWLPVSCFYALAVLWVLARARSETLSADAIQPRHAIPRVGVWLLLFLIVVAIIAATIMWRLSETVRETTNFLFAGSDSLAHVAFFLALAVWAARPRRGHVSMLPLGMIVMLLCTVAGGVSSSLAGQTTVGLAACVGFTIGSQLIATIRQRREGGRRNARDDDASGVTWMGPLFATLTLSMIMMITTAVANVTDRVLPGIQSDLQRQLQVSIDAVTDNNYVGGMRYVSGSRLGSIRDHLIENPEEIALRVYADKAPGYLRGTVFDLYNTRRWYGAGDLANDQNDRSGLIRDYSLEPAGLAQTTLSANFGRKLKRFPLAGGDSGANVSKPGVAIQTLEIHNEPIKGLTVFLPMSTRWIEASSEELLVSRNGIVRSGVDVSRPYVAGVAERLPIETMDAGRREIFLDVPKQIAPMLENVTRSICDQQATARVKAESISRYFQDGFEYGLNRTRSPGGVDPLEHFLNTRHIAHCEYFASATVLMLRTVGVPTRYITGYVVDEVNDEDNRLWYARNRDAHAWVEAFDDASGQWFAVESTPGRRYQTLVWDDASAAASGDGSSSNLENEDRTSYFSEAVGWLFSIRTTDSLLSIFRLAQLPLFCVLAFLLWTKYLKPGASHVDLIDQQSLKRLGRVDRRLRKWSLVRRSDETLYQFAQRVADKAENVAHAASPDQRRAMRSAARWYREYADARYQGELPPVLP